MHNSFAMVDLTGKSSLPEFCNEQKWFHTDKLSIPSYPFWFFMAKNVYLESKNGNGFSLTEVIDQNVSMAIDNNFFTFIPNENMYILAAMLNAKEDSDGIYHLPCNARKNAPTMKFEFVNNEREQIFIEFVPEDYILPSKSGNCLLIFKTFSNAGEDVDAYMLGYSFFKNHCLQLIYDDKNFQQIGFAPKKFTKN